jgi:Flp pilus assembly protein TadG
MMKRSLRNEDGVLLIEASILIPLFIFVILTIIGIIWPCIVQAKIATAMNEAAFDYSQNYYLTATTDNTLRLNIEKFMSNLMQPGSGGDPDPTSDTYDVSNVEVRDAPNIAYRTTLKHLIGSNGSNDTESLDKMLKSFGVVNGVSGLDFSNSSYESSSGIMTFIVKYQVKMLWWPLIEPITFDTQKTSTTKLWRR